MREKVEIHVCDYVYVRVRCVSCVRVNALRIVATSLHFILTIVASVLYVLFRIARRFRLPISIIEIRLDVIISNGKGVATCMHDEEFENRGRIVCLEEHVLDLS